MDIIEKIRLVLDKGIFSFVFILIYKKHFIRLIIAHNWTNLTTIEFKVCQKCGLKASREKKVTLET